MTLIEQEPWYFGYITRIHAEIILYPLPKGSFLVRCKQYTDLPDSIEYALSLRDNNLKTTPKSSSDCSLKTGAPIKHYAIKLEESIGFFLKRNRPFHTIQELIAHYRRTQAVEGLCCPLQNCPESKVITDEKWELTRSDLSYVRDLGEGSWGFVSLGLWRNVLPVAIKSSSCRQEAYDFIFESNIMKDLNHKNLVKLFGLCFTQPAYYIVTEYCPHKNIQNYLQKYKLLPFSMTVNALQQVANGMQYLEARRLVHRDLAARNLLISYINTTDQSIEIKIGDFGHCRPTDFRLSEYDLSHNLPVKWTAIEVFNDGVFTTKSDVWSYGIVIIELFGEVPYGLGVQDGREVIEIIRKGERTPKPDHCPDILYKKCLQCWNVLPGRRPNFKELSDFVGGLCTK